MASSIDLLTLLNFHQWKGDMEIQLRARGLYWITMDIEEEPTHVIDKSRFFNKKDEDEDSCASLFSGIFFSTSRD